MTLRAMAFTIQPFTHGTERCAASLECNSYRALSFIGRTQEVSA